MEYLARPNAAGDLCRAALENVAPWARSVVVVAINYNSAAPHSSECSDPSRGWIARYARAQRTTTTCCCRDCATLKSE